jgi:hypothetical protein
MRLSSVFDIDANVGHTVDLLQRLSDVAYDRRIIVW